jgi:hypothetical protein
MSVIGKQGSLMAYRLIEGPVREVDKIEHL